ncbi:DUF6542 domain-containing protein [Corynebacterium heidelbergense]|uniref:DUF6542 domain-containing protein n=1 Tax=Corynebacterium heidelbergense TaxID=2055947 RepID=UPI0011BFC038|nr:DUF6542 domain-containing protein [Corynebacterium heidelbergense]WCZ37042.1 hypothetical protein CHEID_07545 [Corynebacterium heidelbergense]
MSATSHSRRGAAHGSVSRRGPAGESVRGKLFPVWAPVLVMLAVIITGVVLAWNTGQTPTAYFVIFAVAALACTLLVEPRGLFLTVAALPLYFFLGSVAIGIIVSSGSKRAVGGKTGVVMATYPAIVHYLWLLFPLLLCILLAWARWWLYRDNLARRQHRERVARQRTKEANSANEENARRVRHRREGAREPLNASAEKPLRVARIREAQSSRETTEAPERRLRANRDARRSGLGTGSAPSRQSSRRDSAGATAVRRPRHEMPERESGERHARDQQPRRNNRSAHTRHDPEENTGRHSRGVGRSARDAARRPHSGRSAEESANRSSGGTRSVSFSYDSAASSRTAASRGGSEDSAASAPYRRTTPLSAYTGVEPATTRPTFPIPEPKPVAEQRAGRAGESESHAVRAQRTESELPRPLSQYPAQRRRSPRHYVD